VRAAAAAAPAEEGPRFSNRGGQLGLFDDIWSLTPSRPGSELRAVGQAAPTLAASLAPGSGSSVQPARSLPRPGTGRRPPVAGRRASIGKMVWGAADGRVERSLGAVIGSKGSRLESGAGENREALGCQRLAGLLRGLEVVAGREGREELEQVLSAHDARHGRRRWQGSVLPHRLSTSWFVRDAVLRVLPLVAPRGDIDATETVMGMLEDPDLEVRRNAVHVLGRIAAHGHREASARLLALSSDQDDQVAARAVAALAQISARRDQLSALLSNVDLANSYLGGAPLVRLRSPSSVRQRCDC